MKSCKRLGIDIGSTTVKVAIIDDSGSILFADYERHFANIQETLALLLKRAVEALGEMELYPVITGSGGLTLSSRLEVPFVQEVVAVASSLQDYAPQTDVAIELGGEDAKIIYFTGGIDQRMNGICAGGNRFLYRSDGVSAADGRLWSERVCQKLQGDLPDCRPLRRICQIRHPASDQ